MNIIYNTVGFSRLKVQLSFAFPLAWLCFVCAIPPAGGYDDADGDGMSDAYEELFGLDANNPYDAYLDEDADGLPNLSEYHFLTDPRTPDTDRDGWVDREDDDPVSRAIMDWGNPAYTFADRYRYVGPDWWMGARNVSGAWADSSWVGSFSVPKAQDSKLHIDLDRSLLSSDLILEMDYVGHGQASLHVDLINSGNNTMIARNLLGNLISKAGSRSPSRWLLPLRSYPHADRIQIRSVHGKVTLFSSILYEVSWDEGVVSKMNRPLQKVVDHEVVDSLDVVSETRELPSLLGTNSTLVSVEILSRTFTLGASEDDAEEFLADSKVLLASSDLELGEDRSGPQLVGLRFSSLSLPRQSLIRNAYVQFSTDRRDSSSSAIQIYAEVADDAEVFKSDHGNLSSRLKTRSFVAWNPPRWVAPNQSGLDQRTPNIATILQHVVSRPGWSSGNAIVLLFEGGGTRAAASWDSDGASPGEKAPKLHIESASVPVASSFVAYNDMSWSAGQLSKNITRITSDVGAGTPPDGDRSSLLDYQTGQGLPVELAVTGGSWHGGRHAAFGSSSQPGTDAYGVFDGIVDTQGVLSYGSSESVMSFSGLNPLLRYELVVFGNRNKSLYTNRVTRTMLSGAESFVNDSTVGADYGGPFDPTTMIVNGYNTRNGYVARFRDVDPGMDGRVDVVQSGITSTLFPAHYSSALMLRATRLRFLPVEPFGSLVYVAEEKGVIAFPGDRDQVELDVDSGQTLTLVVGGDATLTPHVEIRNPQR